MLSTAGNHPLTAHSSRSSLWDAERSDWTGSENLSVWKSYHASLSPHSPGPLSDNPLLHASLLLQSLLENPLFSSTSLAVICLTLLLLHKTKGHVFISHKLVMVPLRRRIPSHGTQGSSCMQYYNVEGAERGTVGKESKGKIDLENDRDVENCSSYFGIVIKEFHKRDRDTQPGRG